MKLTDRHDLLFAGVTLETLGKPKPFAVALRRYFDLLCEISSAMRTCDYHFPTEFRQLAFAACDLVHSVGYNVETAVRQSKELMLKKNADYAGCKDTGSEYTNFLVAGACIASHPTMSVIARICDKLCRIETVKTSGVTNVETERLVDTVYDLLNYTVLLAGCWNFCREYKRPMLHITDSYLCDLVTGNETAMDVSGRACIPSASTNVVATEESLLPSGPDS